MNKEKEKRAIEHLKAFQPKTEPYYLCYSGGKDSDVILALADMAGVNFEAVHNLTTVDAPETIYYIRQKSGIIIKRPDISMWDLIVQKKMPPTRLMRYCCKHYKEGGGKFRVKVTGSRWAESENRKNNHGLITIIGKPVSTEKAAIKNDVDYKKTTKGGLILNTDNDENRRFVEMCYRTTSTLVNPIVDWSDEDVYEFLYHYGIKPNPLYEVKAINNTWVCTGCKRVGCIGCQQQGGEGMKADFIRYPKYRDNYLRAFKRMLEARKEAGLPIDERWQNPYFVMMWWCGDNPLQYSLFSEPDYLKGAVEL